MFVGRHSVRVWILFDSYLSWLGLCWQWLFFFHGVSVLREPGPGSTITFTHTTIGTTPGLVIRPTHRRLPDITQHPQDTSMPPGGIRIHNSSKRALADPRHRLRGHRDGQTDSDRLNILSLSCISRSVYTFVTGTWAHTFTMSWTLHGGCRIFRSDLHPCRFSYLETLLCVLQQTTFRPSSMAGHVTSSCSSSQSSSLRLELEAIQRSRTWVNFSSVVGITWQKTVLSHVTLCVAVSLA